MKLNYLLKSLSFSALYSVLFANIANADLSYKCAKDVNSKCEYNHCDILMKYLKDNGIEYSDAVSCISKDYYINE
eukprot:jgi/Orpsp1_1/1187182/evm.model.d7180000055977.1